MGARKKRPGQFMCFPVRVFRDPRVKNDPRVAAAMATFCAAWADMKEGTTGGFISDRALSLLCTPDPRADAEVLSQTAPPFMRKVDGGWAIDGEDFGFVEWDETVDEEKKRLAREATRKRAPRQLELVPPPSGAVETVQKGEALGARAPSTPISDQTPSENPSALSTSLSTSESEDLDLTARKEETVTPRAEGGAPVERESGVFLRENAAPDDDVPMPIDLPLTEETRGRVATVGLVDVEGAWLKYASYYAARTDITRTIPEWYCGFLKWAVDERNRQASARTSPRGSPPTPTRVRQDGPSKQWGTRYAADGSVTYAGGSS